MKLKVRPEDFIVSEELRLTPAVSGVYRLYLLEKRGYSTDDALDRIARELGIARDDFAYGGRKDRHALTRQYVTARPGRARPYQAPGLTLTAAGWLDRPMGPDLIARNRFALVLRALTADESARIAARATEVAEGVCNYFDDQRFGSYDPEHGFLAERLLKRHYRGALQSYLLSRVGSRRQRAAWFAAHWGDWEACRAQGRSAGELRVLAALSERPHQLVRALQAIPAGELSLFFAAYQGFLWNEILRRCLGPGPHRSYPGRAGPYLFPLSVATRRQLGSLAIPTAGPRPGGDPAVRAVYEQVLAERGLHGGVFNLRRFRQAYFKSTLRAALAVPGELAIPAARADALYPGRLCRELRFTFPPGSYGTMLVKALLAPDPNPAAPGGSVLGQGGVSGLEPGDDR